MRSHLRCYVRTNAQPRRPIGRGFTLTELLVVIGILAFLALILTVVGSRAFRAAGTARLHAQIQTIEQALEAYKTDFGSYPTTGLLDNVSGNGDDVLNIAGARGARILCKSLIAPGPQQSTRVVAFDATQAAKPNQDGADGPGFRVPSRSGTYPPSGTVLADGTNELAGRVYGPYLAPSSFKVGKYDIATNTVDAKDKGYDDSFVILDANDQPILYYPVLNPQPAITSPGSFVGPVPPAIDSAADPLPMYRTTDNSAFWANQLDFLTVMGDVRGASTGTPDGAINPNMAGGAAAEVPAVKGKYILWSSGQDGIFGYNLKASKPQDKLDDVTNFTQNQ